MFVVDTKLKSGGDDDDGVLLFRSFFDPLHMDGNGQYMSRPPPFGCLCQTRVSVNFSL